MAVNKQLVQPQAGSPNQSVEQYAVETYTIPAGQSVFYEGSIRWLEIILSTADTIEVKLYPSGGAVPLFLGIQIILDVPTYKIELHNYGSSSSSFSLSHGAGTQPAVDKRLIFNNADILNVAFATPQDVIISSVIGSLPVTNISPLGANAVGTVGGVGPGVIIPAVAGKKIVIRSACIQVSGPATVQLVTTTGQQIILAADATSGSMNLPFPVETNVGDSVTFQETTGSGAAVSVWATFDYV